MSPGRPFAAAKADQAGSVGEAALLARIREWTARVSPPPPEGMGDDCAAYRSARPDAEQLATADPLLYGRHFDDAVTPRDAGRKLVNRNASDIAAMGGQPERAAVCLALAPETSLSWLEAFHGGLAEALASLDATLAGGDVTEAPAGFFGAFLTLLGAMPAGCRPMRRGTARVGSPLYVTGELGGSLLGWHCSFRPLVAEGQWLAARPEVLACQDVSDGLAKDLPTLAGEALAAAIDARAVPVSPAAERAAVASGRPALAHALGDGEDYQLVFALAPEADGAAFERNWAQAFPELRLSRIGDCRPRDAADGRGVRLLNAPASIDPAGYEHLRKA